MVLLSEISSHSSLGSIRSKQIRNSGNVFKVGRGFIHSNLFPKKFHLCNDLNRQLLCFFIFGTAGRFIT